MLEFFGTINPMFGASSYFGLILSFLKIDLALSAGISVRCVNGCGKELGLSSLLRKNLIYPYAASQAGGHRRSIGGEQSQMLRSHPENVRLRGESGKARSQIHIWQQGREALLINHMKYLGSYPPINLDVFTR